MAKQRSATVSTKPNPAFLKLKRAHFRKEGKEERTRKALEALKRATFSFGLDTATIKAIIEDPDLGNL